MFRRNTISPDPTQIVRILFILSLILIAAGTHLFRPAARATSEIGSILFSTSDPSRGGRVWSVTDQGLYRSDDHGKTWREIVLEGGTVEPQRIWSLDAAMPLFVSTLRHGLYRSTDDGKSWTSANHGLPPSIGAAPVARVMTIASTPDGQTLYCATEVEGIYRSDDHGATWIPASAGLPLPLVHRTSAPLLAIDPADPNRVYTLLTVPVHSHMVNTLLFRSADRGVSWILVKNLRRNPGFSAMRVLPGKRVEIAGEQGAITYVDALPAQPASPGAARRFLHRPRQLMLQSPLLQITTARE